MFEELASLRRFQPKFYRGGANRFHLPLLYDLVAITKPRRIVTVGFGDGEAHLTFCQAVTELEIAAKCVAVHLGGDEAEVDEDWIKGTDYGKEFYGDVTEFICDPQHAEKRTVDGSVDLLLVNDRDRGSEIRSILSAWEKKLAPEAIVLLHGIAVERADSAKNAWRDWAGDRVTAVFDAGIGMAIAWGRHVENPLVLKLSELLCGDNRGLVAGVYASAADRIDAVARADEMTRHNASLQARQIWLDSMFADRMKAQGVMDDQACTLAEVETQLDGLRRDRAKAQIIIESQGERLQNFETLRRDRAKAQLVMDMQSEQLKHWTALAQQFEAERDRLKAQMKEQKQILKFAKNACRKKGRCFQIPDATTEKKRRSVPERILREMKRLPRNLLGREETPQPPTPKPKSNGPSVPLRKAERVVTPAERYVVWIEEHEPDGAGLEKQSAASQLWPTQPKISLLLPVFNTPRKFLEEMLASIAQQTYPDWQLCLVDAGSTNRDTHEVLKSWLARESRISFERLESNLGIAENTNRALKIADGDFIVCIDHDDVLAPFALYELAHEITRYPDADICYSDEDRLTTDGTRHSPFFKPKWSPEYLLSSMYLGHLTAYRRELVERVGGFRKEFDLSQDYDFALRATEQARAICHVPHVLYHWREHPASGSAGGKPEARNTNIAALADAMNRRRLSADVIEYPTANRVRFKISEWPKVSIIVPTDSAERARRCMEHLPQSTSYPDYEIVIVTKSALADPLEIAAPIKHDFRFVRYDKPFNFSEKCNLGAQAATGSRLIFFNDDVESGQGDWIQNLIEPLENPEVGGVAPKLLYSNGTIQHAGLVTGVRGLVGTACHQWPGDSIDYTNFAQSMRDVSALSAACLAMRREDFFRVGEFDAVNTPIAHSDLDLSFKIREAGMRCVYTPFVTMTHRGHASIGALEGEEETRAREKASVYLLQRWAGYSCNDPYYPVNVRDWLYADSPTRIRMWGRNEREARESKADLLFVSHDLSWSGAPLILLHVAKWCKDQGFFVAVMSPKDGPLRGKVFEAGIPLLVDPLITTGHSSFTAFAEEFDCVIASTIFGAPIVRAAKSKQVPHVWWIHEGRIAEHYLGEDAELRRTLGLADLIVTPDTRSSQVYQPFADRPIRVLSYGIPDPAGKVASAIRRKGEPLKFLLLGTIEQRKGQQVLLEALRKLPADVLKHARFRIVGRPHDSAITAEIKAAASEFSYLSYEDGVSPEEALALIGDTDVMVCLSWDETGPLILMEALALGKAILSTSVGAVAESLSNEEHGLFFSPGDATALATAIARLVREPDLVERLSRTSRLAYERYFTFDRFAEGFAALLSETSVSRDSTFSSARVRRLS